MSDHFRVYPEALIDHLEDVFFVCEPQPYLIEDPRSEMSVFSVIITIKEC